MNWFTEEYNVTSFGLDTIAKMPVLKDPASSTSVTRDLNCLPNCDRKFGVKVTKKVMERNMLSEMDTETNHLPPEVCSLWANVE